MAKAKDVKDEKMSTQVDGTGSDRVRDERNYVKEEQVMEWLGVSRGQLRHMHDLGLPHIHVGTTWLYSMQSVMAWLDSQEQRKGIEE